MWSFVVIPRQKRMPYPSSMSLKLSSFNVMSDQGKEKTPHSLGKSHQKFDGPGAKSLLCKNGKDIAYAQLKVIRFVRKMTSQH